MNGLSQDTDLAFLQGKVLFQVCIGATEVNLNFDEAVSIQILQDVGHRSSAGELTAVYKTVIPSVPMLTSFLHHSIVRWSVEPPGTLILEFSNQETLEIYYGNQLPESYIITCPGKTIVV